MGQSLSYEGFYRAFRGMNFSPDSRYIVLVEIGLACIMLDP